MKRLRFVMVCLREAVTVLAQILTWAGLVLTALVFVGVATTGWVIWSLPSWGIVLVVAVGAIVLLGEGAFRQHQRAKSFAGVHSRTQRVEAKSGSRTVNAVGEEEWEFDEPVVHFGPSSNAAVQTGPPREDRT